MKLTFKACAAALASAALFSSAAVQARSFWEAVVDTTPAGLTQDSSERSGSWHDFWEDTKTGSESIMKNGRNFLVLPLYTNHPTWDWDNRHEQNGYPMGMGLGRQLIDSRGNERSFFLVNFVDSNYRIEPIMGYQWLARWPVGSSGVHVGAGYLASVTFRGDYMWLPMPLPLPVAKIGTDTVSFYGTYIPFTNVFFFYSMFSFDDAEQRSKPLPASSAWAGTENYFYGGMGWEYMDNGTDEHDVHTAENDTSWHVGMRHYSGRHWATDISYRQSEHDIRSGSGPQYTPKSYRFKTWAVQLQYNIDILDSLRGYAGAGVGYSQMKGPGGRDHSVHPVLSLGATWAPLRHVFMNAEIFTSLARYRGTVEGASEGYVMTAMPTDFTLSVGYAF